MNNLQDVNNFQDLDENEYQQWQNQNAKNNNELYPGDQGYVPDEHDSNQNHYLYTMDKYEDGLPEAGEEHPMAPEAGDYDEDWNDDNGYVEEGGEVEVIGNDTSIGTDFFVEGV
jgi:hypothetical protein